MTPDIISIWKGACPSKVLFTTASKASFEVLLVTFATSVRLEICREMNMKVPFSLMI